MKSANRLGLAMLLGLLIFPVTSLANELANLEKDLFGLSFWIILLVGGALLTGHDSDDLG